MIDVRLVALVLLLGRLAALTLFLMVIKVQWRLMRLPTQPEVIKFRKNLFVLTVIIAAGNLIPIIIDTVSLFGPGEKVDINELIIWYAFSNTVTAVLAGVLIRNLYKLAADTKSVTDFEKKALNKKVKAKKG